MKIADLYIRVSTEEQADKGYSQRDQEERLKRYCVINSIAVRKVIYEDHSAKTFKRPAWNQYLIDIKKNKGKSDYVLFIKWDRFSRNAGDAYHMISVLRKLGVEPQAVEQPLDLSIPENKMMLAFYLAAPEVENDRRALNVIHGMRRAKKEGRWMATAPLSYINTVIDGKKAIAPDPVKSAIMIWAFNEVAKGITSVSQVWKEAKRKGLLCSTHAFRRALANPVYFGKIVIPKYGDEEATEVTGTHEPIISQELFYKVQDVVKRNGRPFTIKIDGDELFPLRGFLECPKCSKPFTASSSKGKYKYYSYYHCNATCGVRYSSEKMNSDFVELLKKYEFPDTSAVLVDVIFKEIAKRNTSHTTSELKNVRKQLTDAKERISRAKELVMKGDFDGADYREIKQDSEKLIERLESKVIELSTKTNMFNPSIINKMANISELYRKGSVSYKKRLMSSIFPQKITYTENGYRTPEVNSVIEAISLISNMLKPNKKDTKPNYEALCREVSLKLQNSNTLSRDLKLLELLIAA